MKLSEYLIDQGILLESRKGTKWEVLECLTRHYCRSLPENIGDLVINTVLTREMKTSTGLGDGLAVPHGRTDAVNKTGILFARFKEGIEWESSDGGLVYFVFLVIGPVCSANEYLDILSTISKILSRKTLRTALLSASFPEQVIQMMDAVKGRKKPRNNTRIKN
ncbi:MAG: PTS sugar transporter subunit IIA [Candidatus Aureabacteria bacterium]|nr:PTS sugar transporter subunit IIA [Candidatus Auribacterota bacterium]